jgi:hypothetical protein
MLARRAPPPRGAGDHHRQCPPPGISPRQPASRPRRAAARSTRLTCAWRGSLFEYGRSQIKGAILYSSAAVAKPLDPCVPILPENRPVTVVGPHNRQSLPSLTNMLCARKTTTGSSIAVRWADRRTRNCENSAPGDNAESIDPAVQPLKIRGPRSRPWVPAPGRDATRRGRNNKVRGEPAARVPASGGVRDCHLRKSGLQQSRFAPSLFRYDAGASGVPMRSGALHAGAKCRLRQGFQEFRKPGSASRRCA